MVLLLSFLITLISMRMLNGQAIYKAKVNGIVFDSMTPFLQDAENLEISHMEMDMRGENFVLFSSASMMFTMNLETGVIFQLKNFNNQNDINLKLLSSFSQRNGNQVLLVDMLSHCIYQLGRNTNTTIEFVGECGTQGYQDGSRSSARFSFPNLIVRNPTGSTFYLTENFHIRRIEIDDKRGLDSSVSTELRHDAHTLFGLAIDFENQIGYYSTYYRLQRFDLTNSKLSITDLSHSSNTGHDDGPLTTATFDHPSRLILLNNDTLLVLEQKGRPIRVIDIANGEVTSICLGIQPIVDGDTRTCHIDKPSSLLFIPMSSKVLVGDKGHIWQLDLAATYADQLRETYRQYADKMKSWTWTISAWDFLQYLVALVLVIITLLCYQRYRMNEEDYREFQEYRRRQLQRPLPASTRLVDEVDSVSNEQDGHQDRSGENQPEQEVVDDDTVDE